MNDNISNLIFVIRDKQVMLDSDVAKQYGYETKVINQTVKRNLKRFPKEFCFRLTENEYDSLLRSQFVTSSNNYGGRRYLPYVFTEQGIAMLSGLLKSDIAIEISIKIISAFVEMRRFILSNKDLFEQVITIKNTMNNTFLEHDKKFEEIFDYMQKELEVKQRIFFSGKIYDAHSLMIDIICYAKKDIIIIDNYIDKTILDLLAKKNKTVSNVTIITNKVNFKLTYSDINNFNKQYPLLKIKYSNDYHDRFIIIDKKDVYHCGASLKDLGKKTFGINKIENEDIKKEIFNYIKK